jgi:hypothetical protein
LGPKICFSDLATLGKGEESESIQQQGKQVESIPQQEGGRPTTVLFHVLFFHSPLDHLFPVLPPSFMSQPKGATPESGAAASPAPSSSRVWGCLSALVERCRRSRTKRITSTEAIDTIEQYMERQTEANSDLEKQSQAARMWARQAWLDGRRRDAVFHGSRWKALEAILDTRASEMLRLEKIRLTVTNKQHLPEYLNVMNTSKELLIDPEALLDAPVHQWAAGIEADLEQVNKTIDDMSRPMSKSASKEEEKKLLKELQMDDQEEEDLFEQDAEPQVETVDEKAQLIQVPLPRLVPPSRSSARTKTRNLNHAVYESIA